MEDFIPVRGRIKDFLLEYTPVVSIAFDLIVANLYVVGSYTPVVGSYTPVVGSYTPVVGSYGR